MRNFLIYLAFFTIILKSNESRTTSKLKADCQIDLCKCEDKPSRDQKGVIEFRVVCTGNGTQEIVLDDEIFKSETKPDWTRKIYVRMTNFSSLTVNNSFLSRWQAYTSCVFDIRKCPKALFSTNAPPVAQHRAADHAFAGIGVFDSDIIAFPPMMFRDKKEVGLKLDRSQLTHLDVASLGAINVNYLVIYNSIIGKLGASQNEKITLIPSYLGKHAEVFMRNATIGIITLGGMAFNDYGSLDSTRANVALTRSTVGVLEEGSINIGRKVSLSITQSNIGLIPINALSIKESGKLEIERCSLIVKKSALKNITCNKTIKISNNILLPNEMFKNCSVDELNNSTDCEEIDDFIDKSCSSNHFWSFEEEKEELGTTTTSVTMPTTLTTTELDTTNVPNVENTTEEILFDVNLPKPQQQLQHNGVPMGLFYLTIGLCLALFVMVMILTALIAWGKKPKRNSGCYDDYDGPSAH